MKRLRNLALAFCACAGVLGLIACGDDKESGATPQTQTVAPESQFAADAEVTSGLNDLVVVARDIAKQTDEAASKKASEGLEPVWMKVEGTVKRNEPDIYATIEEDLSLLESGDAKKTKLGADEISTTVDTYLAKHPG